MNVTLIDPLSVLRRLLDDHQRINSHHAELCALCKDTAAAIAWLVAKQATQPGEEVQLKVFFHLVQSARHRADLAAESHRRARGAALDQME